MARHLNCTVLALAALVVSSAQAERLSTSAVLQATQDNTLFADPDGALSSGAGTALFCGNNSQSNTRRTVLAFDVSGQLPVDATVDSVVLQLFVSSAPNDTPQRIGVHRLLADWGEGTSVSGGGAGAASTPGDATWKHRFYPGDFWATDGGDFSAVESAATIVAPEGRHVWSGAVLTADVQHWLEQPDQEFGWILLGSETTASTVRRFDSREIDVVENRPALIVYYSIDTTTIQTTTWSVLKAGYRRRNWRSP
jgi:hypothetical protein